MTNTCDYCGESPGFPSRQWDGLKCLDCFIDDFNEYVGSVAGGVPHVRATNSELSRSYDEAVLFYMALTERARRIWG